MRDVASENESQGSRGRGRTGVRSAALRKLRLRSVALERLEERALMATLPAPLQTAPPTLISVGDPTIGGINPGAVQKDQTTGNESSPTIVIDPQNSQNMVAVYTRDLTNVNTSLYVNPNTNTGPQTPIYVGADYSNNGGKTWQALKFPNSASESIIDFGQDQSGGPKYFAQLTDPSVAFDGQHNVYITYSAHSPTFNSGEIMLQKYDFSGTTPTNSIANKVLYTWFDPLVGGNGAALTPTLAVDSSTPPPAQFNLLLGPTGLVFRAGTGGGNGNLIVDSGGNNETLQYDGSSGVYSTTLAANATVNSTTPLSQPGYQAYDANTSRLYIPNPGNDSVAVADGVNPTQTLIQGQALSNPQGEAIGFGGDLFVVNPGASGANNGSILRYDGTTGAFKGIFANGLDSPNGLVYDPTNKFLYVSESGNDDVLQYTENPNGTGNQTLQITGNVGSSSNDPLSTPEGLALDPATGDVFIANFGNSSVSRFVLATGKLAALPLVKAGTGGLSGPTALALDSAGNLLVASYRTNNVMRYDSTGAAFPSAGQTAGSAVFTTGGTLIGPTGLLVSGTNLIVVSSGSSTLLAYDATPTAAGGGFKSTLTSALSGPYGVTADPVTGNLYVSNSDNTVRQLSPTALTLKANFAADLNPTAVALDASGNLLIASGTGNMVTTWSATGTYLGTLVQGLNNPSDIITQSGNLYISNRGTHSVLKFDGTTLTSFATDPSLISPSNPTLNDPEGLAFDSLGNLYVADGSGNTVLEFNGTTGGFIGTAVTPGLGNLSSPRGLAFDSSNNLFVANNGGNNVLEYSLSSTPGNAASFIHIFTSPNTATYIDPTTGTPQYDPNYGTVYVSWALHTVLNSVTPTWSDTIQLTSSSDGGNSFSKTVTVEQSDADRGITDTGARNSNPRMTVTQQRQQNPSVYGQGDPGVPGGELAIVWDKFTTGTNKDSILTNRVLPGSAATFVGVNGLIPDAAPGPNNGPSNPSTTFYGNHVNITDPRFVSVTDLTVTVNVQHQAVGDLSIALISPDGVRILLMANNTDASGGTTNLGAAGTTLGQAPGGFIGLTFDLNSAIARSINNGTNNPFGVYRPSGDPAFPAGDGKNLNVFFGRSAGQLQGDWHLEVKDWRNNNSGQLVNWSMTFTSASQLDSSDRVAATTFLHGALITPGETSGGLFGMTDIYPLASGSESVAPDIGIGPQPVIAANTTLGSFSPYEGRLYIAYTDINKRLSDGTKDTTSPADDTNIYLIASDDGGLTWKALANPNAPQGFVQVNNPSAVTDGYSEKSTSTGRPAFEPSLAIDQTTGTVVLSWLDAQNDPSRARVATYVSSSIDGGQTFSAASWANASQTAVDAITGATDIIGPIPDNQSAGNANRDTTLNFGYHQGLAVFNGHVFAAWSSNSDDPGLNADNNGQLLNIVMSNMVIANGPRVVGSTMGPVGLPGDPINGTVAADGTQQVQGFALIFDRPIDPASLTPANIKLYYTDPSGVVTDESALIASVIPKPSLANDPYFNNQPDPGFSNTPSFDTTVNNPVLPPGQQQWFGYSRFLVTLSTKLAKVGTYSYIVLPTAGGSTVSDRVRSYGTLQTAHTVLATAPAFQFPAAVPSGFPVNGDTGGSGTSDDLTTTSLTIPANLNSPSDSAFTPNATITGGVLHLMLNHQRPGDLKITLTAPSGQVATFSGSSLTAGISGVQNLNLTNQLNGSFVEGKYTLVVNDQVAGSTGSLIGWSLTLNESQATAATLTGNAMDQNANALAGEMPVDGVGPGDAYSVPGPASPIKSFSWPAGQFFSGPYDQNTLPLIVAGPTVVGSSNPSSGTGLVQDHTTNSVDVNFDRNIQVSSFTSGARTDFLSTDPSLNPVNVPAAIPDASSSTTPGVLNSTLSIPALAGFDVSNLTVTLGLTHPFDSDLSIFLTSPAGTQVQLVAASSLVGQNLVNATFSDAATAAQGTGKAPYAGIFRPLQSLGAFNGQAMAGTWTLTIKDNAPGNVGSLSFWSLHSSPEVVRVMGPAGLIGQPVVYNAPSDFSAADPTLIPTNVPGNIPDAGANNSPGILASTITIPASDNFNIANLAVTLSLTHPTNSNLSLVLIGPDGTVVPFVAVGALGGANLTGTTFAAAGTVPLSGGAAPYSGTFAAPALAAFNGKTIAGKWTLEVFDNTPGSVGILNSWSLHASQAIPGATNASTPGVLLSTMIIPPALDPIAIGNLTVNLKLTHPGDANLDVYLMSPQGTLVQLVKQGDATGQNFLGTTFDDQVPTTIKQGTAPYTATYRPAQALAAFQGQVLQGTWTLKVVDHAVPGSGAPLNTVDGWSLNVTPAPVVIPSFPSSDPKLTPTNVPAVIPDASGSPGVLTSTITIPAAEVGSFNIQDLKVALDLTNARNSDLSITLKSPAGTVIPLVNQGGAVGVNFTDTIFGDNGQLLLGAGTAPYTGTFKPASSLLSALAGQALAGKWTLTITDFTAGPGGVTNRLNAWSLLATPTTPSTASATDFRVLFPRQQLSGTYTVTLGSSIQDTSGNALDTNHNAGVYALFPQADPNPATTSVNYPSAAAPTAIPDATDINTPGQLLATLNVPDSFVIQGMTLSLNITHPNDPDLEAILIGPGGQQIILFDGIGSSGTHANFTNTTFSDTTLPNSPIGNSQAPFTGTFNPQQALSTFTGTNVNGTWTLKLVDKNPNGLTGTLNSWSLNFLRPVVHTGLGELVGDQATVSFRIFTTDAANALSSSTWTAVGPASIDAGGVKLSGQVGAIAVDPSDRSGNTVYVAGANGGIWKTTNFLTTDPAGPTYIPLTDFGPTTGINIGSIAVFGRNNDPNQSIIIAGTGNSDSGKTGVGFLRSTDGGATWTLLDSTNNNLPFTAATGQPQRDHAFAANGTFINKIVVDPTLNANGMVNMYAAVSGAANVAGIYASQDGGQTWQRVLAGNATDVLLDPASGTGTSGVDPQSGVPIGNLQNVFAAIAGSGIFENTTQGFGAWNLVARVAGSPSVDPLIQDTKTQTSLTVNNGGTTPNGANGRILLAKPAIVSSSVAKGDIENQIYQGWLYALVVNTDGSLNGLFLTKDFGQNWTQVQLPSVADPGTGTNLPSNNDSLTDANPLGGNGNSHASLAIDPTNPNIVYIGGTSHLQGSVRQSGFIRVDVTEMSDAHALVPYDYNRPDGGATQGNTNSEAAVALTSTTNPSTASLTGTAGAASFFNLIRDPNNQFSVNATLHTTNVASFINSGVNARWIPFELNGSDGQTRLVSIVDPLTGHARLILGGDNGVFTTVDNNGAFDTGIGTAKSPVGDRNGNIQITQFYYGALQPSNNLNSQLKFDSFYGASLNNGESNSPDTTLNSGNINWTLNAGGTVTAVATDPTGSGTVYRFVVPGSAAGSVSNFFQVDVGGSGTFVSRTFGLTTGTSDTQWGNGPVTFADGQTLGLFAVNPIDGNQIVIGSQAGRIFRTENQGGTWTIIANPGDLVTTGGTADSSYPGSLAYGAPNPGQGQGTGNHDNFIYAGTVNGHVFVTTTGGGTWTDISAGLDGSGVMQIVTDPTPGSFDAYAVTQRGVYYMANSTAAGASWQNLTGNLFQNRITPFGNPAFSSLQLQGLTSLAVDWRYVIANNPAVANGPTHPMLYVGGNGGVYRSADNGQNWTTFPSTADGAAVSGGYLPNAVVTSLQIADGNINPATGRAVAQKGDPNTLAASTFGRGSFAIRLAPYVLGNTNTFPQPNNYLFLDPSTDTGISSNDQVTKNTAPTVDGVSEQTAFGTTVFISLYDLTDPNNPKLIGGYDPANPSTFVPANETDAAGHFHVQVTSAFTTDGRKTIGVQATDQSGAKGNIATFVINLITVPPLPPNGPVLDTLGDTGTTGDNVTGANNGGNSAPILDVSGNEVGSIVTLERAPLSFSTSNVSSAIQANGTVTSTLTIPASALADPNATIAGLVLDLSRISFTTPADLKITLTGPDGAVVTVPAPYTATTVVTGLNGKAEAGTYTLTITNSAGNKGTFGGWTLNAYGATPTNFASAQPSAPVPANGTLNSTLTIPASALANPNATLAGLTLNLGQLSFPTPSSLTVTLKAPDGTVVTVPAPYTTSTAVPGLNGKLVAGTYTLSISNASSSTGTLAGWSLNVSTVPALTFTTPQPAAPVPASGTVTSTLTVPASALSGAGATLVGLTLNLAQLSFPTPNDLTITLTSPDGTVVPIPAPYTSAIALSALNGKLAAGTYTLSITNAGTGTGTLTAWSLTMSSVSPKIFAATQPSAYVTGGGTLNSSITVAPTALANPGATIPGLILDLSKLVFPTPNDLTVTLTGPDGTIVPVSGPYTAATVVPGLNGKLAAGTYTLSITNGGTNLGTLGGWTLTLAGVNTTGATAGTGATATSTVTIPASSLPATAPQPSQIVPANGTLVTPIHVPAAALSSPSATIAALTIDLSRLGSAPANSLTVTLTGPDGTVVTIPGPYTNAMNVAGLVGKAAAGDYTLTITNAGATATSLGAWSLNLTDSGSPTARLFPPLSIADGVVLDLSQLSSATAINATITLKGPDGTVATVATIQPSTFTSPDPADSIVPNGTLDSALTIPASAVAGPGVSLVGLTLDLSQLNFPSLADLKITLTGPDGTVVPVSGPYTAATVVTGLSGKLLAGTYTLLIQNTGSNTGTLGGWSLTTSAPLSRYIDIAGLNGKLAVGMYTLAITNNGTSPLTLGGWSLALPGTLTAMTAANSVPGLTTGAPPVTVKVPDLNGGNGPIADGVYLYSAFQTDQAGNVGPVGPGQVVTIETTGPLAAPPVLTHSTDTGLPISLRNSDDITNIAQPTFQGVAEVGATVTLLVNGVPAGSAVADSNGLYTVTATVSLTPGFNNIAIRETDIAGNTGSDSLPLVVRLIAAPPPNILPTLAPTSDTGFSNADGITSATTPTFTGTAWTDPLVPLNATPGTDGALVQLYAQLVAPAGQTNPNPSVLVGEALADPFTGKYTVTVGQYVNPQPANAITSLGDGSYNITAIEYDVAGNSSVALSFGATGAVVIDGTDADNHGFNFGTGNQEGWLYMQTVLSLIRPNVTDGSKTLVALGVHAPGFSGFSFGATSAITSAFNASTLPGNGWNIVYVFGASNIDAYLSGGNATATNVQGAAIGTVSLHQTGLLYITTDHGLGDDLTDQELAVVNQHGQDIRNFVNGGGGLYSQAETPFTQSVTAYGWLKAVFPAIQVTNVGPGGEGPNNVQITTAGKAIFPAITNTDISSGPWHDYFQGDFGSLAVVATDVDDTGILRNLILTSTGGGATTNPSVITIDTDGPDPKPVAAPVLEAGSDSGLAGDNITSADNNTPAGHPAPIFDVANVEPDAEVQLYRTPIDPVTGNPTGPAVLVNTVFQINATGTVSIADINQPNPALTTPGVPIPDGTYSYSVILTDVAGVSAPVSAGTRVQILATPPPTPFNLTLEPAFDTGTFNNDGVTKINGKAPNPSPLFLVSGIENNTVIKLLRNGLVVATANAGPGGSWQIADINGNNTTIPDGTYTYRVQQTDIAGNVSSVSLGVTVTIDSTAPAAPTQIVLDASTDSGTFNNDGITNFNNSVASPSNAPVFDVSGVEPNATVQLYRNGTLVNTLTNTAGGTIQIPDTNNGNGAIPDGTYTYTVLQVDLAGNTGPLISNGVSVTINATPPTAPPVRLDGGSDTGISNSDGITQVTLFHFPVFDVTGVVPGATVNLYRNNVVVATLSDTAGGTVFITDANVINDGTYTYKAQEIDLAGNVGTIGSTIQVTYDTVAPGTPAAPVLSPGGGNHSNSNSPSFNVANIEAGATVKLLRDGVVVATLNNASPSGPSSTITISDPGPVPGGTHSFQAFQVDRAGNTSPIGNTSGGITFSPNAPTSIALDATTDSGAKGDNTTNATKPTFDIAGIAAGSTVRLLRGGIVVATFLSPGGGTVQVTDPGPLISGTYVYTAQQVDGTGTASPISTALTVTIATSVATPSLALDPASDSGTKGDNITNVTSPTFDVGNVSAGATVALFRNGTQVATLTSAAGGTVQIADPGPVTPDGSYNYTAQQTDGAGNVSTVSTTLILTINTAVPAPPGVILDPLTDTGTPGDNVTSNTRPTIDILNVLPGATATLSRTFAGNTNVVKTITNTTGSTASYSFTEPSGLIAGQYTYTAQQTAAAGGVSPTATVTIKIDTTLPPPAPVVTLDAASDTGTQGDGSTSTNANLVFDIANVLPGAVVTLYRNNVAVGTATGTAGGSVTITDTTTLAVGTYSYTAQQVSTGGTGPVGPAFSLTIVSGIQTGPTGPVRGDYNADGRTDFALFYRQPNQAGATWFVPNVTPASGVPFGSTKLDVPIQGDFNGDGHVDFAVYRPSTAQWLVGGQPTVTFGMANVDIPVPGDYDGIGKTQYATYRPTTGQWFIGGHAQPVVINVPGYKPAAGDIPAPGNYDGTGKLEEAVYRPSSGQWFIAGHSQAIQYGGPKDVPVPGNYDGVGRDELALYRPNTSQWFVGGSTVFNGVTFGGAGDVPVPGDYDGIGRTQIATYRPTTGQWFIAGHAQPVQYGGPHLVPAGAPYAYRALSGNLSIKSVTAHATVSHNFGATAATLSAGSTSTGQGTATPQAATSVFTKTNTAASRVRPNTAASRPTPNTAQQFLSHRSRALNSAFQTALRRAQAGHGHGLTN